VGKLGSPNCGCGARIGTPRALAAEKAVGLIRSTLGEDWLDPEPAQIPHEIALASSNTLAFVQLLELALRLDEFRDVPGSAVLRRSLKRDRGPDVWRHIELQLELAALAAAVGADVEFERGPADGWPADVVVTLDGASVPFEAFSIFKSQDWREAEQESDAVGNRVLAAQITHDVSIVADFRGRVLAPDELEDWLQRLEAAAKDVARDGELRSVAAGAVSAEIAPANRAFPSRFSGPPIVFNGWQRMLGKLEQKSRQTAASPECVWLRVDVLDGLWQFTAKRSRKSPASSASSSQRAPRWPREHSRTRRSKAIGGQWRYGGTLHRSGSGRR